MLVLLYMEKKIFLLVLFCLCEIATFIGCHKEPLDLGKAGILNLSLKQDNRTFQKSAIESFDARVTIYYGADDTVAYNCRFVDPDDDGMFINDPTVLDCIYIRRDIEFTVGVWAVIQGDTVVGMSDGANPLYFTGDTDFLDVLIELMSGYPRIVFSANPEYDGQNLLLYGEVLEGVESIGQLGFMVRQGSLSDEEKRILAKRVLTSVDLEELFMYADYESVEGEIISSDANKFVGQKELFGLDTDEYSVIAIANVGMEDGDTVTRFIHSQVVNMNAPNVWSGRKIVMLIFKGHKCGNCPRGDQVIKSLEERYGEAVVPIAVHCTYYGNTNSNTTPQTTDTSFNYDFRCEEGIFLGGGDADGGYMGLEAVPSGLVNSFSPAFINATSDWAMDFEKYYLTYPSFSIDVNTSFVGNVISANIKLKSEVVTYRKLSLVAYVIEDGIVGWQFDYDSDPQEIGNYVHNHVLRTSLNGALGEDVKTNDSRLSIGDVFERSYSKTANSDWNIANCKVVVFVYDTDTKVILQAEIANIE